MYTSNKKYKRGITVLEMVLYMAIFSVFITGSFYISFYIQKVYEKNVSLYIHKSAVYFFLHLVQQHALHADSVDVHTDPVTKQLCLGYVYKNNIRKTSCIYPETRFRDVYIKRVTDNNKTLSSSSIYYIYIEWGEGQFVKEYLYIPKSLSL